MEDADIFKFLGVNHNKATEEALRRLQILDNKGSTSEGHTNTPRQGGNGRQHKSKERPSSSSHHSVARRGRRESDSKKSLNFTDMANETAATSSTTSSSSTSVATTTTANTNTATSAIPGGFTYRVTSQISRF